jgi:hypothetical protein
VVSIVLLGSTVLAASAVADPPGPPSPPPGHSPHKVVYPTVETARGRPRDPHASGAASGSGVLTYGGGVDGIGVTTGHPQVYLIFWGSQWGTSSSGSDGYVHLSGDPSGMAPRLQALFGGVGTNNELWSGVMTQYCEGVSAGATSCTSDTAHVAYPSGGALTSMWVDTSAAAPSQATQHQIGVEALAGVAHFGNTTPASNRNAQYVVVSPTGTHPDGFNTISGQFCAWHDYNGDTSLTGGAITSPYGDFAFTNLPYVTDMGASCGANYVNAGAAGTLDGVTIVEGHEYAETITDQNPAGGWTDAAGYENADKCAWNGVGGTGGAQNVTFATGSFAMQATFSNDSNSCRISHPVVGLATNDFSISASPSSVSAVQGGSAQTTINTAVTNGSAQSVSLSLSGAPAGVSGAFAPTSVNSGGSSTLTLTVGSTVVAGSYSLTVTGTGTSATHTTGVTLTVTPANDFSIGASPSSVSTAQGTSTQTTINTAVTTGSAQTVNLSLGGAPAGVSGAFAPSSVTAGGSSTLTLTVGSAVSTGTYTLTVTGTGASVTHSTTVSLTVTLPPGAVGIVNGGFETGNLSGWTTAGSAVAAGPGHTGSYSAVVGSSSPTSGDSSISQTFGTPSGGATVSFWYSIHCPDTVTYDWATVTLRDNTAGTTSTLLGRTCTNNGSWLQGTGNLAGGHQYTITLVSHDDNYPSDPTYVLYDDVTLGPPPSPGIVNGGFESGSLNGWTSTGVAGVTTASHSGHYAGQVGSASPSTDSSLAQTFTAPAAATKLSFWYYNYCPDTVTYDWATVTLRDNTTSTTTTPLGRTCRPTPSWKQVTVNITAGHSYTLTLVNHDDNYWLDPTFTLYDDVATS